MYDAAVLWHWAEFAVRWVHVITAIAWIGSSFYFIALDLGLHRDRKLDTGADGEEWQVHGGGFYNIQKYLVAPARLPGDLVWFKWESYSTWLSGFTLLVLVYWLGGELYLIDPNVLDIPVWQGALISAASLAFGWVVYDQLCRSRFGDEPVRLMLALFGIIVLMSLFYTSVFSGRAALLHLGAFTATIMSGNVFFTIIPNQKVVVADLIAGRTPELNRSASRKITAVAAQVQCGLPLRAWRVLNQCRIVTPIRNTSDAMIQVFCPAKARG